MHAVQRYGASVALAAVVTFSLFFLMQALIASSRNVLNDETRGRILKMVRVEREETLQRKDVNQRPPEQIKPPKIETPKTSASQAGQTLYSFVLNFGKEGVAGLGIGKGDGEYLPIVNVAPPYPERAAAQGIEGYALIELTVNTDGTVKDPVVIEAEPNGYFERAALNAAQKLRFKPRIINGQPVEVPGVRYRFIFDLPDK